MPLVAQHATTHDKSHLSRPLLPVFHSLSTSPGQICDTGEDCRLLYPCSVDLLYGEFPGVILASDMTSTHDGRSLGKFLLDVSAVPFTIAHRATLVNMLAFPNETLLPCEWYKYMHAFPVR